MCQKSLFNRDLMRSKRIWVKNIWGLTLAANCWHPCHGLAMVQWEDFTDGNLQSHHQCVGSENLRCLLMKLSKRASLTWELLKCRNHFRQYCPHQCLGGSIIENRYSHGIVHDQGDGHPLSHVSTYQSQSRVWDNPFTLLAGQNCWELPKRLSRGGNARRRRCGWLWEKSEALNYSESSHLARSQRLVCLLSFPTETSSWHNCWPKLWTT